MILNKTWEKYLLREIIKVLLLFITSFYILYVVVDYSIAAKTFSALQTPFTEIIAYYGYHFSKRIAILMPFALMLATIKTLTHLNVTNELLALLVGGIRSKNIMRPFIVVALACMTLIFLNSEFFLPKALDSLNIFEDVHQESSRLTPEQASLHTLYLMDGTTLLYQSYNSYNQFFFDVYWLKSSEDIVRIKYLYPFDEQPTGYFVDHCTRDEHGDIIKASSFAEEPFDDMRFDVRRFHTAVIPPENLAPSTLWKEAHHPINIALDKQPEILTWFYFKMMVPFICLLAVIGPASFCFKFDRTLHTFMIYVVGIFLMVSLFTILDATRVLGENNTYSPFAVIAIPLAGYFLFFGWKFFRIR